MQNTEDISMDVDIGNPPEHNVANSKEHQNGFSPSSVSIKHQRACTTPQYVKDGNDYTSHNGHSDRKHVHRAETAPSMIGVNIITMMNTDIGTITLEEVKVVTRAMRDKEQRENG